MKRQIRIAASLAAYGKPVDTLSSQDVKLYRGTAAVFTVGIFAARVAETALAAPEDIEALESATVALRPVASAGADAPPPDTPSAAAATTGTFDAELTWADWQSGSGQHFSIELSSAALAIPAGHYWLTLHGIRTDGEKVVFAAGVVTLLEGAIGEPGEPEGGEVFLSLAESDARYFRAGQLGDGELHLVRIDATATGQQVLFAVPAGYSARIGMLEIATVAVDTSNDPPELEVSLGTELEAELYLERFTVEGNTLYARHIEEFASDLIPEETEIALTIHTASNSTGHQIDAGIYIAITPDPEEE